MLSIDAFTHKRKEKEHNELLVTKLSDTVSMQSQKGNSNVSICQIDSKYKPLFLSYNTIY